MDAIFKFLFVLDLVFDDPNQHNTEFKCQYYIRSKKKRTVAILFKYASN